MAGTETVVSSFAGLKGGLLFFAGILALAGLALNSADLFSSKEAKESPPNDSPSMKVDWADQKKSPVGYSVGYSWGDIAIRIGLSFGVAMIFASLLRAFLKTVITVGLIVGAVCWFLNGRGLIDPFWLKFDLSAREAQDWLFAQTESAKGFLAGVLPSTGAAIAGFLFGLRR
ncbi:MAG: hypothetical protein P1U68_04345 [Verrucomicrobiales bacterium]|nr:hypothetical protein [Verrucomicrobiales bacterium]